MQISLLMQASQVAQSSPLTHDDVVKLIQNNPQLTPDDIFKLSVLATAGLAVMWLAFWIAVILRKESVHEVLLSAGFFRTVAVMGVVAATVVLSLAGRLEGNITGAILSGIVGYVLGQLAGRGRGQSDDRKN